MLDLGTVRPGSTIRIPFSTFDKDDGSSITMTNYAAADILIYKDGGTTERASTAGFTATTDFDGKTGKHLAVIDLADNTTADFYASGSEYLVAIDAVTVDAVTTGGWIARFRIGYPSALLDTTIATLASQTSFTLTTGPAEDDTLNGMWAVIHDAASAVQLSWVLIADYTGSTKTVTLAAGATFTVAAKDNFHVILPAPLQATVLGRALDVSTGGEAGVDWANVGSPTTTVGLSGTTVKTATDVETDTADIQTRLPAALGANGNIKADLRDMGGVAQSATDLKDFADDGYDPATNKVQGVVLADTVTTYTGNTPQTGDAFARLGAPAGASVSADVAAVQSDTNDIQTRLPAALVSGRIDASVGAMAANVMTAAAAAADLTTELQAGLATAAALTTAQTDIDDIQARLPAALTADGNMKSDALRVSGSDTAANNLEEGAKVMMRGTVTTGATTTSIPTSAMTPATSVADQLKDRTVIFDAATTTAGLRGAQATISASTASATPTLTVSTLPATPVSGDLFTVV